MSDFYEVPNGINWCKANLKIIIANRDLKEIMDFGDLWRERGHTPLVHTVSPAMDGGRMWDQHKDPSGLLNNIPAHIDMFIVDFYNLLNPEVPANWANMTSPPKWLLWEYASGKVRFNGTYPQFINTFKINPVSPVPGNGGNTPEQPSPPGSAVEGASIVAHLVCPHCGKLIL